MRAIKLHTKMALFICLLLLIVLGILGSYFTQMISETLEEQTGKRALHVATTVAEMPAIREAFNLENPSSVIQPIAEDVRIKTGAEFVVVGNKDSIRYSHPIPERIGKKMVGGDNDRALIKGEAYVSKAVGSLGPSLRGKAPIFDENGEVIGIVSVGFLLEDIETIEKHYQFKVMFLVVFVLTIGAIGSFYISKGFKKAIFGLEPHEIASLFVEKHAILESVREGIIAINNSGNITMVNQQAYDILGMDRKKNWIGQSIHEVIPNSRMVEVLQTKESHFDEELKIGNNELIVNRVPIFNGDDIIGVVSSFRKKTEIDQLTKELTQVHRYAEALRAQTHEYSNKLNTISGLIQLGSYQEALDFIHKETVEYQTIIQQLMRAVPDTMIAAIILGKYNRAHELKIDLQIDEESSMKDIPPHIHREKLVTIIGNLLDNAFDAVLVANKKEKTVHLFMTDIGDDLIFEVEDSGNGIPEEFFDQIFQKGVSTKKGEGRGMGLYLANQAAQYLNGYITVENSPQGGAVFTVVIPKRGKEHE
jgi:two-component system, CitB family, sensor kinase